MKFNFKLLTIFLFCTLSGFSMAETTAPEFPESYVDSNDHTLVLNGSGVRTKVFVKLYRAGLYLSSKQSDAKAIIEADEPMVMTLTLMSNAVTSARLKKSLKSGLSDSVDGNFKTISNEYEQLKVMLDIEVKADDQVVFEYIPNTGTVVLKNGEVLGTIEGLVFKKALIGIWLSDKPAQKSLKKELLAG